MYMKIITVLLPFLLILSCIPVFAVGNSEKASDHAYATVNFYNKDGEGIISSTTTIQNMTDNDDTTHYRTVRGVDHGEITIDLYQQRNINRIYIQEAASVITNFELALSQDNREWNTVHSGATIGGYGRTYSFDTCPARFVKLRILSTDNEFGDATITLKEFQAYFDSSIIRDDLNNALYLARIKADFIQKDVIKEHYTAQDASELDSLMKKGEKALLSNIQSEIDTATHEIDNYLQYLSAKPEPGEADYNLIYQKFFDSMVGNNLEYNDERKETIRQLEDTVEKDWELLIKNPSKQLFEEYFTVGETDVQPVADSLQRVIKMATAYLQEHNKYYQNEELLEDIINAIRFVIDKKFDNSIEQYGNWYGWVISVPRELANCLILLDRKLPEEMKGKIHDEILYRTGGENYYKVWSGGNRTYLCNVYLKLAASTREEKYFRGVEFSLQDQCIWINSVMDEGFLYDGTFAAHISYVYNSGYGLDLLNNSANFITMLHGTIWEVDQSMIDDLAKKILLGFEPMIVNGIASDVVGGRGLGRGLYYGKTIPNAIANIAAFSAEPYKTMFQAFAKECALQNGTSNRYSNDNTIVERGPVTNFKRFVMGDKVVYSNPNFGFGLGMYSNRIRNFERVNDEVRKAWYCNSGALYVMNHDVNQYNNNYWIAVNHYHIPGTTVDMIPRKLDKWDGEGYSPYSWVSSMDFDEKYGCAGYTNYNFFSTLKSLKSYFVFDDEIVCIGSGISGGTENIETTIDNQRMRTDNSNEVYINNEKITKNELTGVQADTIYLEGNTEGDSFCYYFPGGQKVNYLNSYRGGLTTEFWSSFAPEMIEDYFTEIWIDHGKNPSGEKYAYVMLPNQSRDYLNEYAKNPDIEIIQQDDQAHIVSDKKLGLTGYNIWAASQNVTKDGITTSGPVIMMTKETDYQYEISLTDPTMERTEEVVIEFPQNIENILECSDKITVLETKPLKISVDVKDIKGKKLTLLTSKLPCEFVPELFSDAIYYHVDSGTAVIHNRLSSDFSPLIQNENIYICLDEVAEAYSDRFHYSKTAGAYQLITDDSILTIRKDGSIYLNGEKTVYAFQNMGTATYDVIIANGKAYVSLEILNDVYHVKSYWDGKNLIFNIGEGVQEPALKAIEKYVLEVASK